MYPVVLALSLVANPVVGVTSSNCVQPNVPPSVSEALFSPIPSIADSLDQHGVAQMIVRLAPTTGRPERVTLSRSTGYAAADDIAIRVAQHTTFKPELQSCAFIGGDYFYELEV